MSAAVLIDGDILAYKAGFATDKTTYLVTNHQSVATGDTMAMEYFDDHKSAKTFADKADGASLIWSRKETDTEEQALLIVDVMIRDVLARYRDHVGLVFLSGVGNFRNAYATRATYKGNRAGSVPPTHLKAIRAHMASKWSASVSADEEADDLMAIHATKFAGSIIASIDKDMLQVPGLHYNFVTKEEVTISPKQAAINLYSQVLTGDSTDNIPGVGGCGPVCAAKTLEGAKGTADCWKRTVDVYQAKHGNEQGRAFAIEAARLVYLRRTVGELWSPPDVIPAEAPKALEVKKTRRSRRVPVSVGSGDSEGSNGAGNQV